MAVLLSHASACTALPRAIARATSLIHHNPSFSLFHHFHGHYHHPPLPINNFSAKSHKFPHCIRAHCIEDGISEDPNVISSPNLVALEYADLNLPHHCEEVGHVRIRQHVNPLSSAFTVPVELPDWDAVFRDPSLPLMVDIGCGSGRFLLWLAKRNSSSNNYLGLEIRKKLVKRANFWVNELSLTNAHFIFANATVSFQQLVSSYPGPLALVSILCPDPHFKKRHHKRRVLQKPLVESIVSNLTSGGQVFLQSDVLDVAADMRNHFDVASDMLHIDAIDPSFVCEPDGWLLNNPMGIRTEREIHAELEGAKIYRRMYQKKT